MGKNLEVVRLERRLTNLFEQTELLPDDIFIRSHWARYLCILSAGYLETSVRAVFSQYAKEKSSPYVANYVELKLKRFQSAKMNNILQLAETFNPDWAEKIRNETEGELSEAVNSIVNNRHQLAHGKDTGVSLAYVKVWHKNAMKVIKLIEEICS